MLRFGIVCLLALFASGCGELTRIPPPPVPLSVVDVSNAAVGDGPLSPTGGGVGLAKALPPNALITVHLPDISGTIHRFKKTSLYRMFTSPEMRGLFGPVTSGFSMASVTTNGIGDEVLKALSGEFAMSIMDISLDHNGKPDNVRLVAALTVGGSIRKAEQLLGMIGMMAASAPDTRVEKGTVGDTPFTRIVVSKPKRYVIEMALYRNAFVLGVGRDTVTEALKRLRAHGRSSIAYDMTFRRALERCGDPRDALRIHIDVASVLKKFGSLLPSEAMHLVKVIGLDQFKALTVVARLERKDIVLSTLLSSPGGKDLLTGMLAANPVDRRFFTRIPSDAKAFSLFPLDGGRVLKHLREILRDDLAESMESALRELGSDGLDLERDVFDVFGPRCAIVNLPYGNRNAMPLDAIWNQILGTALVVDIRDAAGARRALAKLPKSSRKLRRRTYRIGNVQAVSYDPNLSQLPEGFAPSYALVDDFLIVALSEETLRRMLESHSPMTAKRYRDMFSDVPATVAALSYENTRESIGLMMGVFLSSIQRHIPGSQPVEAVTIHALTRGFNPTVSYTLADDEGIFQHTRSPTAGIGGLGGASGLLAVAAIAIPSFTVARQTANEQSAIATLQALHAAQQTFRANVVRDEDSDGEGEFGFLSELLGEPRKGERRVRQHASLVSGFHRDEKGNLVAHGYRFRVYLPAEDGSPIGGDGKKSHIRQVDGDLAEAVMLVVAWPVDSPSTGRRAYVMNGSGHIFECVEHPYEGNKSPPPDVLSAQAGNLASEAIIPKGPARDGCRWLPIR